MGTITFFGKTDVGHLRSNNEDAFIAQYIWDEKHILAVAIDGVGGYEGGEIAASLAQKSIVEYLESYSNGERLELLKQAVIFANNRVYSERKNLPQYCSMSCVLTAVLVEAESKRINMAHIGDTRLYQFANGKMVKLSHDHSLVGYREEIGELTEEEAMKHPQRNVIGRDVGSQFLESSGNDYIEIETFPLIPNSILLLCSDGLCDMITSEQMKIEIEKDLPIKDKVDNLIKEANKAGGKDNVTVVLVESINPESILPDEDDIEVEQIMPKEHNTIETSIEDSQAKLKNKVSTHRTSLTILISIILVIIGILLFSMLRGYVAYAQNYNEYLEAAQKHLRAGDKEKAISCYNVYKSMTGQVNEDFESMLNPKHSVDKETIIISVGNTQIQMKHVKGGNFKGRVPDLGVDCQRATAKEWNLYDLSVKDYYIATTEVTQALWQAVMGEPFSEYLQRLLPQLNHSRSNLTAKCIGSQYPVYCVSSDDVKEFIMRLNQLTGRTFRLPTTREWIFAESGGNESLGFKYSGSNDIDRIAWYEGNSKYKVHPVASKLPNELGLYDFSGNVKEWTQCDYWGTTIYGGSYLSDKQGCLLGNNWRAEGHYATVGFRLAMDYTPPTKHTIEATAIWYSKVKAKK